MKYDKTDLGYVYFCPYNKDYNKTIYLNPDYCKSCEYFIEYNKKTKTIVCYLEEQEKIKVLLGL
jgi:hypothetical protein